MTFVQQIALLERGEFTYTLAEILEPDPILEAPISDTVRNTLKDVIQIGLDSGAIVITQGMGGDTVVDLLFALAESGELNSELNDVISAGGALGQVLSGMSKLNIRRGPRAIYEGIQRIIGGIVRAAGDQAEDVLAEIQEGIQDLLNQVARAVSKWVSTILPDDAGLGGPAVRLMIMETIEQMGENAFDALTLAYNALPSRLTAFVQSPAQMEAFFNLIVDRIVKFLGDLSTEETVSARIRKMALRYPLKAIDRIKSYIDTTIRKMIPVAVRVFQMNMTVFFGLTAALQVIMAEDYEGKVADTKDVGYSPEDDIMVPGEQVAAGVLPQDQVLREFIRASLAA